MAPLTRGDECDDTNAHIRPQAWPAACGRAGRGHTDTDFAVLLLEQAAASALAPVPEDVAVSDGLDAAAVAGDQESEWGK